MDVYTITFIVGVLVLLLAMAYSYDKKPGSRKIMNFLWALAIILIVVGLAGQYFLGKTIWVSLILMVVVNCIMWVRIKKSNKENSAE